MDADHHIEALRRLVDTGESRVAEHVAAVGGEHRADEAQLAHAALELRGGRLWILKGQQGDRLQPWAPGDELLVQERVVRAADRDGPGTVLEKRQEQAERRVENRRLHPAGVQRLEPLLGGAADAAERPE